MLELKQIAVAANPTGSQPKSKLEDGAAKHTPSIYTRGFGLIDLLVTVAIVAILTAISYPGLRKAKANYRCTHCLAQMKQWAMASLLYVDDSEGWLPREGFHKNGNVYWNNWPQVQADQAKDAWYNVCATYAGRHSASSYGGPGSHRSFYQPGSFFQCPSARIPEEAKTLGFQLALFSRAMNSQLINPPRPSTRFAEIKQPARIVLFLENLLEGEQPVVEAQAKDSLGQPAAYANRFAGRRHGRAGNLVFGDGHAETVLGEKVVQTKGPQAGWAMTPAQGVCWYPDEE